MDERTVWRSPAPLPDIRVLLVDDVDENLLALEALLEREGVGFLTARSGTEALELLLREEVSLAIIDVRMPEMDGFELAELMRGNEATRQIPIIFVTAENRDAERVFKGYDAGAVDVLFKPLDPHVLRNKVETFYELSRQRQLLAIRLEEREELADRLEETLRLNEMFVAVTGHDMGNPLAAVVFGAERILNTTADERVKRMARVVYESGERMARMVDDLHDLARARLAGGIPVEPRRVELSGLARRVIDEVRGARGEGRIRLLQSGDLTGAWDEDRVAQLLSNLLGNAVQHSTDGGEVTVSLDGTDPGHVTLAVHNPGQIPEEIRGDLFDAFRGRRRSRQDSHAGTGNLGLGLYIVRKIAEAHGGSVEMATGEEEGTTFTVQLARGEDVAEENAPEDASAQAERAPESERLERAGRRHRPPRGISPNRMTAP